MSLFRVPKVTEYALRSLGCLARSGQQMSVREIAEQERIPPASLAKILHMLCWQGLVHSKRGRLGGFWLARAPDRIRLREVVEIFQGPFEAYEPRAAQGFPAAWESLCAPTRHVLESLTVADLLRLQPEKDLRRSATRLERAGPGRPQTQSGKEERQ